MISKPELIEKLAKAEYEKDHYTRYSCWEKANQFQRNSFLYEAEMEFNKLESLGLGLPGDFKAPDNPFEWDDNKKIYNMAVAQSKALNPKRFIPLSELPEK